MMLLCAALLSPYLSPAQSPDSLILELKAINGAVVKAPFTAGRGDLVSNRAMNIFLSEKAGYYLSGVEDLTLYKNSVVANAAEGTLAVYHNLHQPQGIDERVRSFLSIGARANVADAFAASYAGRQYSNQFGFLIKQTWIGKGHTNGLPDQRSTMDALRAGILHTLGAEIAARTTDFEKALDAIDPAADLSGQSPQAAREIARRKFNADLRQEYEYKWALLQSEALSKGFNYRQVAVDWTSVSLYIPLITQKIETAPSFSAALGARHAYPLHANISHTWLWENTKYGRFWLSIGGDAFLNNSRDAYALYRTNASDYKSLGGADTLHAASFKGNELYIGVYKSFVTPALKGQFIYFPPDSHIGVSFLLEQNLGSYKALNGILGVPVVLIDKAGIPAFNCEFQVRWFDLGNKVGGGSLPGKTSIGLSIGVPFSKIAY